MAFLGFQDSASWVRESRGNGKAKRVVGVVKENRLWVCRFRTAEELRLTPMAFKDADKRKW